MEEKPKVNHVHLITESHSLEVQMLHNLYFGHIQYDPGKLSGISLVASTVLLVWMLCYNGPYRHVKLY